VEAASAALPALQAGVSGAAEDDERDPRPSGLHASGLWAWIAGVCGQRRNWNGDMGAVVWVEAEVNRGQGQGQTVA
jgi:hypothetical protein